MTAVPTVLSAALLLAGAASCLLGALGLVRFPDLPSRLQAATKPQTLCLLAYRSGTLRRDVLVVDDLGARLSADDDGTDRRNR